MPNWAKIAIGVGIIAGAAALTVATGGAAAGTVLAAVNCMAHGAMVGAITQGAIGAVSGAASGAVMHRMTTGSWSGAANAAVDGAASGFLSGTITGAVTGALSSPYCFVAGTTVLAAVGAVAIETIQENDYVWAWDEETGEVGLKKVVETYINKTDELVHVHVNGEEIITTPSHPFYSPVKGWTDAVHLRAGDILVLVNGEYVVVEKVQHEILEAPIEVYNFQVEDYHTYYVTNAGVLVHNSCKHQSSEWAKTRRDYWKNQAAKGGNDTWYLPDENNLSLMRQGKAPIGYDGERVVLHHVKGIANDMNNFVEIGAKAHREFHKTFGYHYFIDLYAL